MDPSPVRGKGGEEEDLKANGGSKVKAAGVSIIRQKVSLGL